MKNNEQEEISHKEQQYYKNDHHGVVVQYAAKTMASPTLARKSKQKESSKEPDDNHRTILRQIMKSITSGSKLQGTIMLPRFDYNRQPDDEFSVCYYAKEYLDRRSISS
uniref:Uncharacterized protein n=1 Tax=Acrobeloides nanus TaxID=290746 RepID=A0A914DKN2_9BILA